MARRAATMRLAEPSAPRSQPYASVFGPPSSRRWKQSSRSCSAERRVSATGVASLRAGDAHYTARRYDDAARSYVEALELFREQDGDLVVAAYLRLGHANRKRGKVTASVHCFKKALAIDPEHVPTLQALLGLHVEWNEYEEAAKVENLIFRVAAASEELTRALVTAGDLWWKRGHDAKRARARYRDALNHTTTPAPIYARLLDLPASEHDHPISSPRPSPPFRVANQTRRRNTLPGVGRRLSPTPA